MDEMEEEKMRGCRKERKKKELKGGSKGKEPRITNEAEKKGGIKSTT